MEVKSQVHIVEDIESTSSAEILKLIHENQKLIDICNDIRLRILHPPSQSNFRVVALFIVEHTVYSAANEGKQSQETSSSSSRRMSFVCGSNAEQGYIGGAICAERATLTRLRFYENVIIQKIAITTDSEYPISPGALCREYLMTAAPSTTSVVLGNASGKQVVECQLSDFYPFPYVYRHCLRCNIIETAETLSKKLEESIAGSAALSSSKIKLEEQFPYLSKLLEAAKEVNSYDNDERSSGIHPIAMSGAAIFSDGKTLNSWQLKALEYGCTVDPIVQLIGRMKQYPLETKEQSNEIVIPLMIVMIDQFNVCHAPFAAARTLLVELGYVDINVLIHNSNGELIVVKVHDLYPVTTGLVGNNLSHDDFR
jgi:cytidine deaminase